MGAHHINPNKLAPAATLLVLPQIKVRELLKRFDGWQFRDDRCMLNDLTGREVKQIESGWYNRGCAMYSKGNIQFHYQLLPGRPELDKADRVVFYMIGTPLEVSSRLGVDVTVPERLREETVIFVFHIQYAM